MLTEEMKNTILQNNQTITDLLRENEKIFLDAGYQAPGNHYGLSEEDKVHLPNGYIRVNEHFISDYHLNDIVHDYALRKNIAYSIQFSDLHNFMLNRLFIWGSVRTMLIKGAVVNLISVFEALVFECASNICCNTHECTKLQTCTNHFNNKQRTQSYEALLKMKELGIITFTDVEIERIHEIIGFRNRIHIKNATENEFISSDFSLSLYNELIVYLKRLTEMIYQNGVPMYNQCTE